MATSSKPSRLRLLLLQTQMRQVLHPLWPQTFHENKRKRRSNSNNSNNNKDWQGIE